MKTQPEYQRQLDVAKLLFLAVAVVGTIVIFIANPALSTPSLLAIVTSMILSPVIAALERRGLSRTLSIVVVFSAIALSMSLVGYWVAHSFTNELSAFKEKAPEHFQSAIRELHTIEEKVKLRYSFLNSLHPTDSLLALGQNTGQWFAEKGANWAQSFLMLVLLVPPLSFVILNDGRAIRRRFFDLVPNRYFESFFLVSNQITTAISDYLRAKLVEAFLVGLMTTTGLFLVNAPYAILLGIIAGLTNILPYIGPVIGAVPALLVALFDHSGQALLFPVSVVYVTANLVDMLVIFPVVVAKLVNLHPLLLIAVVAIGQEYYGLIGMLISIPIASACKVILGEVYFAIYERNSTHREHSVHEEEEEAA